VERVLAPLLLGIQGQPVPQRAGGHQPGLPGEARFPGRRFRPAVFAAAQLFDNHFSFDFSGPWAPHNFVEIDLEQ